MKKVLIFSFLIISYLYSHDSPYSKENFQPILDVSKLQAPLSSYDPRWATKYGDFKNFFNKYFYLSDGKYMVFEMCGKKHRSELRVKNIWRVSTKKPKTLEAKLKIFPLNQKREFTFLQIHADSTLRSKPTINKPLLRISWIKELHNKKDHIWAIIRVSNNRLIQKYLKLDLGKRAKKFFNIKIVVQNSNLQIFVDGIKKVDMDVGYWDRFYNYFKAGVYLQDEGCSKVLFEKLVLKDVKK